MTASIALWAHPRSLSTALERSFSERGDFTVFHEPFSYLYYVHEARAPIPHKHPSPDHPLSYRAIRGMLTDAATRGPVFHKDMCYHCADHVLADDDFLASRINTFLIRDPAEAILSHATIHPGLGWENLGYEALLRVFERVTALTGRAPVVVNADDIQRDPAGTLRAYCAAVGIPYLPSALSWRAGERTEWAAWREWHAEAANSTGIGRAQRSYATSFEAAPRLARFLEDCLPIYRALDRHRLRPLSQETERTEEIAS